MKSYSLTIILFFAICNVSFSQNHPTSGITIFNAPDKNGRQIPNFSFHELKGSPYLAAGWVTGSIELRNGEVLENIPIRFNQIDQVIDYQLDSMELPLDKTVKRFIVGDDLNGNKFESGYPKINANTTETFYEVLKSGNIKLLKLESKRVAHFKGYSQVVEQKVIKSIDYYLVMDNKISLIKPNASSVKKVLLDNNVILNDNQKPAKIDGELDLIAYFKSTFN